MSDESINFRSANALLSRHYADITAKATEPPTVRVWTCGQCGKREPWGPGWSWYGSLRDLDLTGEPEYVVCSRACRERTATRRKHNPELLDQPTEGEQA